MASRNWKNTYSCDDCGASECKLWREYNTFIEHQKLRCAMCACKKEGKNFHDLNLEKHMSIGFLVPAVPTKDGTDMYGYTSIPLVYTAWWYTLKDRPMTDDDIAKPVYALPQ